LLAGVRSPISESAGIADRLGLSTESAHGKQSSRVQREHTSDECTGGSEPFLVCAGVATNRPQYHCALGWKTSDKSGLDRGGHRLRRRNRSGISLQNKGLLSSGACRYSGPAWEIGSLQRLSFSFQVARVLRVRQTCCPSARECRLLSSGRRTSLAARFRRC